MSDRFKTPKNGGGAITREWVGGVILGQVLPLLFFLIFSVLLSIYKFIQVSHAQSLGWDSASFLENGAVYAGYSQYQQAYDPTRPPVLPVLLSLMFRITGPSAYDGYLLSCALYFLAMLGSYLLASEIMNPWLAVLAGTSYGVAPMVAEWGGIMYSDVEGVAFASLGLAIFVYATRKQSERGLLYLLALPLLLLAPLTRYAMGAILISALVYIVASKNTRRVLSDSRFPACLGLSIPIVVVFATMWILYPIRHGLSILSLFPMPQQLNPFESSLGHEFFAVNFPDEAGAWLYGYVITGAFILAFFYALALLLLRKVTPQQASENVSNSIDPQMQSKQKLLRSSVYASHYNRSFRADPLVFALLAWFVLLFAYYSLFWPYSDPRYSVEFIMPALILAYWGIGTALSGLYSSGRRKAAWGRRRRFLIPTVIAIILVVFLVASLEVQSSLLVIRNTPVVDTGFNAGIRQAANWIESNAPLNSHIEGDWYTLLQWYMPNYNIMAAPASYQLQTSADYQSWMQTISQNNVSYVVYTDPYAISVPPELHPVFSSSVGGVVVYQVLGS